MRPPVLPALPFLLLALALPARAFDGHRQGFLLGGGPSETVQVYFDSRVTWFRMENLLEEKVTMAHSLTGVGVTWYPKPRERLFFEATLGVAVWDAAFEEDSKAATGAGLALGAGFEFQPHWSVSFTVLFTSTTLEDRPTDLETNTFA